ncbi:spindle and centriole-associated protein 1 isoform X2 [Rana temporaria]|uniref:spindle and centriole-associated protein 1 isoform X2 n=1 Tax=Rana temporaria TaxID=8407 RepID=UPI001AADE260|nr:spindle and centriole-associated protein 1 isoform X2 [Rana temporaria]
MGRVLVGGSVAPAEGEEIPMGCHVGSEAGLPNTAADSCWAVVMVTGGSDVIPGPPARIGGWSGGNVQSPDCVRGEERAEERTMSVRYGRPGVKKTTNRKRTQVRQAWDSSVQDLNVHRATPEELAHRHEIHKSKNQRLAQWEFQKRSLKKKWRKQNGGAADPLEERRLALMMEILSDQYRMKDVLERSDRAISVVKDLFGDAPRRHTGFPNVTTAPSCDLETSCGPIVQKKDPPTRLSILSESVMDSQALNDVDESGSEEDDDDDDEDVSITFQPGLTTDRAYQIMNEERFHPASRHPSTGKEEDADNQFVTPKSSGHPTNGQIALNATTAVRKVKTRLTEEEQAEPEDPKCVIGRILNPNPPNHHRVAAKGKKKRSSRPPTHRRAESVSAASACEMSSCSQSSLDVLSQMMQEVELDLEDYEKQTGREVDTLPKAQGLTGFTMSLVGSIRRLVCSLKEGDRRLHQEILQRQRLQEEFAEQRLLIDALTAEILSMKENFSMSLLSQQVMSDSSPSPLQTHRAPPPKPERRRTSAGSLSGQSLSMVTELDLQDVEKEKNSPAPPRGKPVEHSVDVGSLLGFQPAILLSPPQQRTRKEYEEQLSLQNAALRSSTGTVIERPLSKDIAETRSTDSSTAERRTGMPQDPGRKGQSSASVSSSQSSHPSPRDLQDDEYHREQQSVTDDTSLCNDSIAARMAEMTFQNNVLKARLKEFGCNVALSPGLVKPADSGATTQSSAETKQGVPLVQTPKTLEQRITELNRQSAEARNKLLSLIEQQKQSAVISPAISPITPQNEDSGKRERIEGVIPMPRFTDFSIEETPSPDSRSSSGRRLEGRMKKDGLP